MQPFRTFLMKGTVPILKVLYESNHFFPTSSLRGILFEGFPAYQFDLTAMDLLSYSVGLICL
jgi:hypothetical protein